MMLMNVPMGAWMLTGVCVLVEERRPRTASPNRTREKAFDFGGLRADAAPPTLIQWSHVLRPKTWSGRGTGMTSVVYERWKWWNARVVFGSSDGDVAEVELGAVWYACRGAPIFVASHTG